jgi:hypothetical protein
MATLPRRLTRCSLLLKVDRMCRHLAQFYDETYPAETVSEFFASGLEAGDSCLALLTAAHRRAVEQCLQARGIVVERAAYVAVDSDDAWSQMQADGRLDLRRAHDLLAPLMKAPAGRGKRRVRAVGDLAPTLCAAGKTDDAVAFERLVHRLTKEHGASTICAYPIQSHRGENGMHALLRLSAEHAVIEFPQRQWVQHLMPSVPSRANA